MTGKVAKVLVFSNFYYPGFKGGGPIKTLRNLFSQVEHRVKFELVTSDRDLGDLCPYTAVDVGAWNEVDGVMVFYSHPRLLGLREIFGIIRKRDYDLVYINSFFSIRYSVFPQFFSFLFNKKVILAPRGEFSEGALRIKFLKKIIYIMMYKLLRLQRRVVFQASTEYEARDISRALGAGVRVKVVENIGSKQLVSNMRSKSEDVLRCVFVSRISKKKNLLGAIKCLMLVKSKVQLDIYGPIEDSRYWDQCIVAIESLPQNVRVRYKGPINPEAVVLTMAKYDVFFMPTMGENYGHVIAEALCAGLPLLISNATPWRNLQSLGIGWDLPLEGLDAYALVLDGLSDMTVEQHWAMRCAVLKYADKKFSYQKVVEDNVEMFVSESKDLKVR